MGMTNHKHKVIDSDMHFTIDVISKTIVSNHPEKDTIVQGDHNAERFTFELPRYIEGHDMLLCNHVDVAYINAEATGRDKKHSSGVYMVEDLEIAANGKKDTLTCSWLISKNATEYAGVLRFALILSCMSGEKILYRWKTNIFGDIIVAPSLDSDLTFELEYLDVIEQWKNRMMNEFYDFIDESVANQVDIVQIDKNKAAIEGLAVNISEARSAMINMDSDLKKDIALQKSRIDNMAKLSEGSTTGDAELLDIRVGHDGIIRDSAGEAIRDQFDQITMNMTKVVCPNRINPDEIVTGYMGPTTGDITESSAYVTTGYIHVNEGDVVTLWSGVINDYYRFATCFDANRDLLKDKGDSKGAKMFTVPEGVSYIRFSFRSGIDDPMILINEEAPAKFIPYKKSPYYVSSDEFMNGYTRSEVDAIINNLIITPRNASFFDTSPNMFNGNMKTGCFINQNDGTEHDNPAYLSSDFIVIKPNTPYIFSNSHATYIGLRYAIYDIDKNFILGSVDNNKVPPTENAAYLRFSLYNSNSHVENTQLEVGTEPTAYRAYDDNRIPSKYIATGEPFELNLPSKLYALVGEELNVYFDNLVDGRDTDYEFDVTCSVGQHMERCYRLIPEDVGSYELTISATKDGVTVSKNSTIIVSSADQGAGETKSVIILGDSTTNNGIAVSKLNENFKNDVMNIETLGTRGTGVNKQEGRSGWTFKQYFTMDSTDNGSVVNAFYNPDTKTFDANYYFINSGVNIPDYFIINLGINDTFNFRNDETLNVEIEKLNDYCDSMITSLRKVDPTMKVCVALTIPPNYSQDAFGKNYKCNQTRHRYKRNNIIWVANLIERYDNREDEGIYVIPIHTNLDTRYNMGMETVQYNKRNTATCEQPIGNGGVHPVESGYWQIADVYWFFLKAQEE